MDGQSTDGSVEILKNYGPKIQWVSEPDHGQSDALNKGFKNASGDIIGWLNSDDRYEPGSLEAVGIFFSENPGVPWVFGNCKIMDEQGREIQRWISAYKAFKLRRYCFESHLVGNFISQMGVFMRRQALQEIGGVNEKLHYAMDYDLWLRLGKRLRPGYIPRVLGHFRVYGTTKSMSNFKKRFDEDYAIARGHAQGLPGKNWLLWKHRLSNALLTAMYTLLLALTPKKGS